MILGVGLVSLATLFPIGLLRLRDAARSTRTKYLVDSAAADGTSGSPYPLNPDGSGGGLLNPTSFARVDVLNYYYNYNPWYMTAGGQCRPVQSAGPGHAGLRPGLYSGHLSEPNDRLCHRPA